MTRGRRCSTASISRWAPTGRTTEYYLADAFRDGLQKGVYPMAALDDKVRRNLRVMIATHVLDGRPEGSINTRAHQAAARRVAEEAIVLLKNAGHDASARSRPADLDRRDRRQRRAAAGPRRRQHGDEGVLRDRPLEGILRRVGDRVNVTYSPGYGEDAAADLVERAVEAAKAADVAIVVGGLNHDAFDREGADRRDLKLPYGQDELIRRVVQANPRTIVVLVSGSPVEMDSWLDQVPAVVEAWYGGMEGGNALARVLFGDVNPSGKLPCTFPQRLEDTPAFAGGARAYPGVERRRALHEGLLVGYRWYDTKASSRSFRSASACPTPPSPTRICGWCRAPTRRARS